MSYLANIPNLRIKREFKYSIFQNNQILAYSMCYFLLLWKINLYVYVYLCILKALKQCLEKLKLPTVTIDKCFDIRNSGTKTLEDLTQRMCYGIKQWLGNLESAREELGSGSIGKVRWPGTRSERWQLFVRREECMNVNLER